MSKQRNSLVRHIFESMHCFEFSAFGAITLSLLMGIAIEYLLYLLSHSLVVFGLYPLAVVVSSFILYLCEIAIDKVGDVGVQFVVFDWCCEQYKMGKTITVDSLSREFPVICRDDLEVIYNDFMSSRSEQVNVSEKYNADDCVNTLNKVLDSLFILRGKYVKESQKELVDSTISKVRKSKDLVDKHAETHIHYKYICRVPSNTMISLISKITSLSDEQLADLDSAWDFIAAFNKDLESVYNKAYKHIVSDIDIELKVVSSIVGYNSKNQIKPV